MASTYDEGSRYYLQYSNRKWMTTSMSIVSVKLGLGSGLLCLGGLVGNLRFSDCVGCSPPGVSTAHTKPGTSSSNSSETCIVQHTGARWPSGCIRVRGHLTVALWYAERGLWLICNQVTTRPDQGWTRITQDLTFRLCRWWNLFSHIICICRISILCFLFLGSMFWFFGH